MDKDDQFSKFDGQRTKLSGISGVSLSYLPGDIVDNDYQLLRLLGRGGMGAVYACRHLKMDKQYALKLLSGDTVTGEAWTRFQSEAKSLARLNHPGIVTVYNMGVDNGQCPYYVMDLLAGETLDTVLKHAGRLKTRHALDIFIQMADALASAHMQGIIHRDIKPSNMMLVQEGRDQPEQVKIVDFGIARVPKTGLEAQNQTATGLIFGTPFYMSPEQCQGAKVDQRSDIYSFGCTLFEALSGEPPFVGESAFATFMMHQTDARPLLPKDAAGQPFPESLQVALNKMMGIRPSDRYQTMNQVKHDLERIRAGKTIMAQGLSETLPPANSTSQNLYAEKQAARSGAGFAKGNFDTTSDASAAKHAGQLPLLKIAGIGLLLVVLVGGSISLLLNDQLMSWKPAVKDSPWVLEKDKKDNAGQKNKDGHQKPATNSKVDHISGADHDGADKTAVAGAAGGERDATGDKRVTAGGEHDAADKADSAVAEKSKQGDSDSAAQKKTHEDKYGQEITEVETHATSELQLDSELTEDMPPASPLYPWKRMVKFGASKNELLSVQLADLLALDDLRKKADARWRELLEKGGLSGPVFMRAGAFNFPPDVSLGSIKIDDRPLHLAMGRIPVKPGSNAFLYMISSTRNIPTVLDRFGPEDLTGIGMVFDKRNTVDYAITTLMRWKRLKDLLFFNPLLKTIAVNTDDWGESFICDEDLPLLDKFKGLRAIGLCYPATGPAILKRPFLKKVEALELRRIDNFKPLLNKLPQLDNLKEVLFMTLETTDDDLKILVRMKNLQKLTILRGYLTYGSLHYFQQMKALKELHIDRNDWSQKQKDAFEKALPHCHVFWEKVIDIEPWPFSAEMTTGRRSLKIDLIP